MTLVGENDFRLRCDLVPWSDGVKVKASTPCRTPWRTIQIAETPGGLLTTYLILNLNESNKLGDVSWVKPVKYVGIWWGMHLGTFSWESGPIHGATTANAKRYIDFAADNKFDAVLIEGWNTGWDGDWIQNGRLFNFTQPYPDFDIAEVTRYAASKGVEIIGHHETAADIGNYEKQMEAAFQFYKSYGVIPYIEHDIEKDAAARRDYNAFGGRSVPVIFVGKRRMNGFRVEGFNRIYR